MEEFICHACNSKVEGKQSFILSGKLPLCEKCGGIQKDKMRAGFAKYLSLKKEKSQPDAIKECPWCGDSTSDKDSHADNVCKKCAQNRSWLSRCIEYSDFASKYVAKKEAALAEKRRKDAISSSQLKEMEEIKATVTTLLEKMQKMSVQKRDLWNDGI